MEPEDRARLGPVLRRSLTPLQRVFFSWGQGGLIAELDGAPAGGMVLRTIARAGGRRMGFVDWVFTDPAARGQGVAGRLLEEALRLFEQQGCAETAACVEGHNTRSSAVFAQRGFGLLSPGEQVRRFGGSVLGVWLDMGHLYDVGHFVWARPAPTRPDSPALQWLGTWLANALIALVGLWRQAGFASLEPLAAAAAAAATLLVLGLRAAAMALTARLLGLRVRFRAWESGLPIGLAIASATGFYFPSPGGVYPAAARWNGDDERARLGPAALMGTLTTLAVLWLSKLALLGGVGEAGAARIGFEMLVRVSLPLALLDSLPAFWPFTAFNARRLWEWKRWAWALCAAAALGGLAYGVWI